MMLTEVPNSSELYVKFNVTKTSRPDLLMKKEGGMLSNGKRIFLVRDRSFETARYELAAI